MGLTWRHRSVWMGLGLRETKERQKSPREQNLSLTLENQMSWNILLVCNLEFSAAWCPIPVKRGGRLQETMK